MIGLGAIGVTLTYSILRFSNFAHGDFMAWGTYATLVVVGLIGAVRLDGADQPLSFGLPLIIAAIIGMALTGLLALLLDYRPLHAPRARGQSIVVVMASFGASMALRSLLEFIFTSRPDLFQQGDPDGDAGWFWHPHHAGPDRAARRDRRSGDRHAPADDAHPDGPLDAGRQPEPGAGAGRRHRRRKGGPGHLDCRRGAGLRRPA